MGFLLLYKGWSVFEQFMFLEWNFVDYFLMHYFYNTKTEATTNTKTYPQSLI